MTFNQCSMAQQLCYRWVAAVGLISATGGIVPWKPSFGVIDKIRLEITPHDPLFLNRVECHSRTKGFLNIWPGSKLRRMAAEVTCRQL